MSIEDRLESLEKEKVELLRELYEDDDRTAKFAVGKCYKNDDNDFYKIMEYKNHRFVIISINIDPIEFIQQNEDPYFIKYMIKNYKPISNKEFKDTYSIVMNKIKGLGLL